MDWETVVAELDRLKEQLAYLKFWQGIMVLLTLGILALHRQINCRIDQAGKL